MTRDQLVAHVGGYLAGGNVVKDNVCYGRMVEGVFVLTPEGEAAIAEAAVPAEKPAKRAPKAKPVAETEEPNPLDALPDVE